MNFKTTSELLKLGHGQKIFTGVGVLDNWLHGGIPLGKVYEIVGKPGAGKTQMCLHLCLNVQLPKSIGGLEGGALFIDTTRGFNPARLQELAQKQEQRYKHLSGFTVDKMLKDVFYVDCPHVSKLIATIISCQTSYLADHQNIKLIVIDSICFPIRMLDSISKRTALLMELHDLFHGLISKHNITICITNDLSYQPRKRKWVMEPILGNKHMHLINERIWLTDGNCYIGKLLSTQKFIGKLEYNFLCVQKSSNTIDSLFT